MEPLQYAAVKAILGQMLGISARKSGVFKGQLDHLRKLGVPPIASTGSGRKARYSFADGFELLVALRLERIKCSPQVAKVGAKVARREIGNALQQPNWYLICDPDEGFLPGDAAQVENMTRLLDECLVVNLSRSAIELQGAWQSELDKMG